MQIKCLHPTVILNPEARNRALEFHHLVIKNRVILYDIRLFLLDIPAYNAKRYSVSPDDLATCYLLNTDTGDTLPLYICVPCGRCLLCRKRSANDLAARAIAETNVSGRPPLFITLTYDNLFLRYDDETGYPTLCKVDLQLFLKRLRSLLDNRGIEHNLRYFACGEYGSKSKRPHYHMLLWNFPVDYFHGNMLKIELFIMKAWSEYLTTQDGLRIRARKQCRTCPFASDKNSFKCVMRNEKGLCNSYESILSDKGSLVYRRRHLGIVRVLPGNAGAPAYITKYMVKGSNAPASTCEPPFRVASNRNGGIGSAYIRSIKYDILKNPGLEAIPIPDKVTGSNRVFYLHVNSWVKNTLLPGPSNYLPKKEYEQVREFVSLYSLFYHVSQQLYRLYPMDKWIDGTLHYYYDDFCDPKTRSLWYKCYKHCSPFVLPDIEHYNLGNWIKTRELFNEYIYTLTERLDILAEIVLKIPIDHLYFVARKQYQQSRYEIFAKKFKDVPPINLTGLAENIVLSLRKNQWREVL